MKYLKFVLPILILLFIGLFFSLGNLIEIYNKLTLEKPKAYVLGTSDLKPVESTQSGKIIYPHDIRIILLGDSMTERLGNGDELKGYLSEYYPQKTIEVLNYSYGSTNINSVLQRIEQSTFYFREFRPINSINYNLLVLESFGYNPAITKGVSLEEALRQQNLTLDKVLNSLKISNPDGKIIFLATIAPSRENYAKRVVEMTDEGIAQQVKEREAFIENHISYAKDHQIPIIDVYHNSKNLWGSGKSIYITPDDNIHPSPTGVIFISKQIADFIAEQKVF